MVTGVLNPFSSYDKPADPAVAGADKNTRVRQAAQNFEALLIGNLFRSMQHSFSSLPGGEEKPVGFDDYDYMATQAIASAMSEGGGLGLSKLILRQLAGT